MKKTIKAIIILLISIVLIFNLPLYSKAVFENESKGTHLDKGEGVESGGEKGANSGSTSTSTPSTFDEMLDGADNFISIGNKGSTPINQTKLTSLYKMISGVLLTIAIAVTMISSVLMGINFLIQSVEDKAKIKESMVPWIIGIIICFGAYGIWEITIKIFTSL